MYGSVKIINIYYKNKEKNMYEKISDKEIRNAKVEKVKQKILKEIEEYSTKVLKRGIQNYLKEKNADEELWNSLIMEEHALLKLKEYIQNPNCFQEIIDIHPELDVIIYYVTDKTLDIWLQEDFNFTFRFLNTLENMEVPDVFVLLDDDFLDHNIGSIIDRVLYDQSKKEEK